MPQLGCHSESSVSACESAASKPRKRKKDEVSGETVLLISLVFGDCLLSFIESEEL